MHERKQKILHGTQFGNPILVTPAQQIPVAEITSEKTQNLIADLKYTVVHRKYGVGLAAPQVGVGLAISVISIKATPTRKMEESFDEVIINPKYEGIGKKAAMWEGCLSFGSKNAPPFAQTMRYKQIKATYHDKKGNRQVKILSGFPAHVFQHETDHLMGILFPSRVEDHTTWMNTSEYKKRIVNKKLQ